MMRRRYLAVGGALAIAAVVAVVVAVVALSGGGGRGETSVADADGTSEGITVHGHWVIEVREPDGALVSRHEFDNALTRYGKMMVSEVLEGTRFVAWWQIELVTDEWAWCPRGPEAGAPCVIAEPGAPNAGDPEVFANLLVDTGEGEGILRLRGSFTAPTDNSIDGVATMASTCSLGTPPESCSQPFSEQQFSSATLSPAVSVLAGQQVLVRVTFSFS